MSDEFKDQEVKVVQASDPALTPRGILVIPIGAALLCLGFVVYGLWFKDPPAPPPVPPAAPAVNLPTAAFGGIGAAINPSAKGPIIARAFPGTPSERAGLHPGDVILTVDGVSVTAMDVPGVSKLLRGPDGSTVTLTYSRDDGPPRTVSFKREVIQPSVFQGTGGK